MSASPAPTRYPSLAIAMHWLTALLIGLLFATGFLAAAQPDGAAKVALLRAHLPFGAGALLLTVLRIGWWLLARPARTPHPAGQPEWQAATARGVHWALYGIVLLTAASGIGTIALSGALPAIIAGAALPDLDLVAPRLVHGLAARLMLALLALHVGAALYHQFVHRDHLMARMGLGH